jgi:hypothetical protein
MFKTNLITKFQKVLINNHNYDKLLYLIIDQKFLTVLKLVKF